jgi:hypothetical protein
VGNQTTPEGAVDFLGAGRNHLTFRFGMQRREPLLPAPPPDRLLPARYIRIQAASPPPKRVDGTPWDEGLVMTGGGRFVRTTASPPDGRVDPLGGVAPLGRPDPDTIVFDRWLAVPAVPPTRALTRTFEINTADPSIRPLSFLSVPYPDASVDGKRLAIAGVDYYYEGTVEFDRPAKDEWIAVSLERFFPPERASAELIVRVPPPQRLVTGATATATATEPVDVAPTFPVTVAWRVADPDVTSASQSSPGSE